MSSRVLANMIFGSGFLVLSLGVTYEAIWGSWAQRKREERRQLRIEKVDSALEVLQTAAETQRKKAEERREHRAEVREAVKDALHQGVDSAKESAAATAEKAKNRYVTVKDNPFFTLSKRE